MTAPLPVHRLRADDFDYGTICPDCAAPKHRQSKRCAPCYHEQRRQPPRDDPRAVCACGRRKDPASVRCVECYFAARRRGEAGPGGRPQPLNHPWRGKDRLLYRKRVA